MSGVYSPKSISPYIVENFDKILDEMEDPCMMRHLTSAYSAFIHQETQIRILISVDSIPRSGSSYDLIPGKASLQAGKSTKDFIEVPCFVAYGGWCKLGDVSGSEIDLVEHFDQLFPRTSGIGLFTCQNGIQNDLDDFEAMCNAVILNLTKEKPLFNCE